MKIISNLHTEFYLIRQRYFNSIKAYVVLVALLLGLSTSSYSKNLYFSSSTGDDSYTAIQAQNPATPWKTIDKLTSSMSLINPGDSILFKRGEVYADQITRTHLGPSLEILQLTHIELAILLLFKVISKLVPGPGSIALLLNFRQF